MHLPISVNIKPVMDIYLTKTADKSQRKLDKPLRQKIMEALMRIAAQPEQLGERLTNPLSGVYSHHITYQGKEYRIAYQVCLDTDSIRVLLIGPHENFYRRLQQHLYAS